MSKLIKKGKFALVVSLAVSTAVWSIGLAAFTPTAFAVSAGDLIKQEGQSAVYYIGSDSKRYVFPSAAVFDTWYDSDATITTVSADELLGFELGGNVVGRAGRLLQFVTSDTPWAVADAKVYAVSNNGVRYPIDNAETAAALFGDDWETRIMPVEQTLLSNYTEGDELTSSSTIPDGFLITDGSDTYVIEGGQKRAVSAEGFTANNFKESDKITVSDLSGYADGSALSGAEDSYTNVAGGASADTQVAGGLTVALSSDTPVSSTIPSNSTGSVFTKVDFTAGSDADVTITGLVITRTGVGSTSDFSKIYVYDGDTRLTSGKTINSSTNQATFSNLSITVSAGATKTLSIVGDIGNNKNGQHALGVASVDDITTTADVSGTFPATGNLMSLSTTSVGLCDVESNGSDYTRKIGESDVEVANFSVHINSTEDATFNAITLYNSGRDIFDNLKLYRGSDLVAEGVESGNYFIFTLDTPYAIEKSQSASFTVRGDVTGRNSDTGTLYVRYDTDVEIVGSTYGYNLSPTLAQGGDASNSYIEEQDSSPSSNTTTAEAGQVTIATNGPVASDVPENTNNVELLNFSLTAASNVDIEKASISISTDSSDALVSDDVENLELVCGGTTVAEWATVTIGTNSSTDIWQLTAGETTDCTVRIDFTTNPDGGENITATLLDLTSSSNWTLKDSDTGDSITDVVPSGNIAGNEMTVQTASLTLSLGSVPASGTTYVKGTSDVSVAGFVFTAGNASDVKITSIKLTAYADDDQDSPTAFADTSDKNQASNAEDVMGSITIYDGDTVIAGPKALTVGTSDVSVTFSSINWTVPAGASKLLTAKADISTTAPLSSNSDYIALAIASTSDVSAEYGSGTSLTPSGTPNTTPSTYQTVASSGTLTMGSHADTPDAGLLVAGTQGAEFTKVKFTATNEDFIIDKLRVVNDGYGSYGDDEFTAVVLEYTNSSGSTETKSGIFVAGNSDFTDLDIYVPKDDDATLIIKADLNTTAGGADNGAAPSLKVDFDTNFQAIGQGSSTVVTSAGSADVDGNAMTIYESIPSVAFASDTPSGTLTPSANTLIGKLTITADAGEDITFDSTSGSLTVQYSLSGGSTGTASTYLKDSNGNTLDTQTIADTSATSDEETFTFASNTLTVAKGTSQTVYIYMDTTNFNTIGDTVQVWLDDVDGDIAWEIDNGGTAYGHGDIIFKGDLYGGSLVKP